MKLDTKIRQRQVSQAAIILIHIGWIQNLTIKKIALEVGFSEQAIYRHFENKLAILEATISFINIQCGGILEKIKGIQDPLLQFLRFMEILVDFLEENGALATVIFSEELFRNDTFLAQGVKQLQDTLINFVATVVKNGQDAGKINQNIPVEDLAFMILGSLRFLVTVCRLSGYSFSLKERSQPLIETVLSTMTPKYQFA